MAPADTEINLQIEAGEVTTELLEKIGISPDLLGILMGILLASILPQTALIKKLVSDGLIGKDEGIGIYDDLLTSSQFPLGIKELIHPIWTKTIETIQKAEA